jgi:hypothetical protein
VPRAQQAQIAQIVPQCVARLRIEGVVVDYVLYVVNGGIELAFFEMASREFPIEVRKMLLSILITRDFLAFVALEVLRVPQIVLRSVDNYTGMILSHSHR